MSASPSRREVIHVALGSDACQVTAQWLHRQGTAAGLSLVGERCSVPHDDDRHNHHKNNHNNHDTVNDYPPCVADITHSLPQQHDRHNPSSSSNSHSHSNSHTYIPRAVLVDAGSLAFDYFSCSPASLWSGPDATIRPLWHGRVERMVYREPSSRFPVPTLQDPSRLAGEEKDSFLQQWGKPPPPSSSSDVSRRHVDWEAELRDEMEPSNPNDSYHHQQDHQHDPNHSYKRVRKDARCTTNYPATDSGNDGLPSLTSIPWFFPETCLTLPMNPWQDCDDFYTAAAGATSSHRGDWNEEIQDRIRRLLEECDACQGIVVVASSSSSSSSTNHSSNCTEDAMGLLWDQLSTSVLHMAQEECPGAKRWMVSVNSQRNHQDANDQSQPEQPTQESLSMRMPRYIRRGLTWNEHVEGAHLLLPLQLTHAVSPLSAATALEAISLPYRLSSSSKHSQHHSALIALQSYYSGGSWSGDFPFGTATHLTMHEYVTLLRSSTNSLRSILELDAMVNPFPAGDNNTIVESNLWQRLQIGTSWERRFQVHDRLRPATVLPGQWLGSFQADAGSHHAGGGGGGGLLQNFSYTSDWKHYNRALHHHFSLSTALRTAGTTLVSSSSKTNDMPVSVADYTTALMEGMGIGVRPEQSMATVLQHPLSSTARPVLAVLGNTTRVYPLLHTIATEMKLGLSARHQSWYNREVANGRLPEIDDCQEALAHCWDVRDAYCPPEGSGLVEEEIESYIDE